MANLKVWQRFARRKAARGILRNLADFGLWLREPALVIGVVLASTTAIAQPFYVPTGSMEPTIAIGDEIFAAKYAYGYGKYSVPLGNADFRGRYFANTPRRGDVVVFHPSSDPGHAWVKRVIGLPGDKIQMIGGRLYINDHELALKRDGTGKVEFGDGSYRKVPRFIETLPNGKTHPIFKWLEDGPLDNTEAVVVPADRIFLMGDDRDNSFDSRVPASAGGIGFVPMDNLVGKAEFITGSVDFLNASSVLAWPAELRVARFFKAVR